MSEHHLLLLDASGFAHRAYHRVQNPTFRSSDGLPNWAITGFLEMVWRLLGRAEADPWTHGCAVFDPGGKTMRHEIFPAYKANRPPARNAELAVQMPYMEHAALALGLTPLKVAGFEADDVIATLAAKARKYGARTTIVSSDKDFCQLVVDDVIEIIDPLKRTRIREEDVRDPKKFGVDPYLVPDVQALAGDPVDNIPGVDGIGLKTAAALIRRFRGIGDLIKAAETSTPFDPKVRKAVRAAGGKNIRLYKKLATLHADVPLPFDWTTMERNPIEKDHLFKVLETIGAGHMAESIFGLNPSQYRPAEVDEDPLKWWREELVAPGQAVPTAPQCGFYQRRLVRGGPLVKARIYREKMNGSEVLACEVDGRARDPLAEWPKLWMSPIREAEYNFRGALATHVRKHEPTHPLADPRNPIDLKSAPLSVNPKARKKS